MPSDLLARHFFALWLIAALGATVPAGEPVTPLRRFAAASHTTMCVPVDCASDDLSDDGRQHMNQCEATCDQAQPCSLTAAPTSAPTTASKSASPAAPTAAPTVAATAAPTPTATPTVSPAAAPTAAPTTAVTPAPALTPPSCMDGTHCCDKTECGISFAAGMNSFTCDGQESYGESSTSPHTCTLVTAAPAAAPTASPTASPTAGSGGLGMLCSLSSCDRRPDQLGKLANLTQLEIDELGTSFHPGSNQGRCANIAVVDALKPVVVVGALKPVMELKYSSELSCGGQDDQVAVSITKESARTSNTLLTAVAAGSAVTGLALLAFSRPSGHASRVPGTVTLKTLLLHLLLGCAATTAVAAGHHVEPGYVQDLGLQLRVQSTASKTAPKLSRALSNKGISEVLSEIAETALPQYGPPIAGFTDISKQTGGCKNWRNQRLERRDGESVEICAERCKNNPKCLTIEYRKESNECYLVGCSKSQALNDAREANPLLSSDARGNPAWLCYAKDLPQVKWHTNANVHCRSATVAGKTNAFDDDDDAAAYKSLSEAKESCRTLSTRTNGIEKCEGVYDSGCTGLPTFYLCKTDAFLHSWDASSCVYSLHDGGAIEKQRHDLLSFYHSMGGPNWHNGTDPTPWDVAAEPCTDTCTGKGLVCKDIRQEDTCTAHDECMWKESWHGITCKTITGLTGRGVVTQILLPGNNLTGMLSAAGALASLTNLERLDLRSNHIFGTLPANGIGTLTTEHVLLSDNEIEGTLPSGWGMQTGLQVLDLGQNRLRGELPTVWSGLTNLRELYLGDNELHGPLRTVLFRPDPLVWSALGLTQMQRLDLHNNSFSGSLDSEWLNPMMRTLQLLDLSHNKLAGTIPQLLGVEVDAYGMRTPVVGIIEKAHVKRVGNGVSAIEARSEIKGNRLVMDLSHNRLTGGLPWDWVDLEAGHRDTPGTCANAGKTEWRPSARACAAHHNSTVASDGSSGAHRPEYCWSTPRDIDWKTDGSTAQQYTYVDAKSRAWQLNYPYNYGSDCKSIQWVSPARKTCCDVFGPPPAHAAGTVQTYPMMMRSHPVPLDAQCGVEAPYCLGYHQGGFGYGWNKAGYEGHCHTRPDADRFTGGCVPARSSHVSLFMQNLYQLDLR